MPVKDINNEDIQLKDWCRFPVNSSGTIRRAIGRIVGTIKKTGGDVVLQIKYNGEIFTILPVQVERLTPRDDSPADISHISHDDDAMTEDLV
jgi:hypothetical protein